MSTQNGTTAMVKDTKKLSNKVDRKLTKLDSDSLSHIKYRGFVFPYNPAKSSYRSDKTYIKHKYPELVGTELEDLGTNACVISGEGEFFGEDAYSNWRKLLKEYNKKGVGAVSHPVFTDITRGMMVSLYGDLEPMKNYIRYSFEIVADNKPPINEDKYKNTSSKSNTNKSKSKSNGKTSGKNKDRNEFVHVVVKGECLSVICAMYAKKYNTTISWRAIAKYNNMKNPNLIYAGDKIKIYYPT